MRETGRFLQYGRLRKMSGTFLCVFTGVIHAALFAAAAAVHSAGSPMNAAAMEHALKAELLDIWYPASVDSVRGGFLSDFSRDWKPAGPQHKMLVTQARHVWTASCAALFFQDAHFRKIAEHGFCFLRDRMRDPDFGGFYMLRNRGGGALPGPRGDIKSTYGNAFAIYALAAYYRLSGDSAALSLAAQTFEWLENHAHDPDFGGYFDALTREGKWLYLNGHGDDMQGYIGRAAWKDQNTSIHLMEAFAALYRVWPDSLLRERLLEMFALVRDTMVTERGCLTLFFERDWTPVSFPGPEKTGAAADHVSFGHDVETAYLLLEAAHALGIPAGGKTLAIARKMVDHALAHGWDHETGGFFDSGRLTGPPDSLVILNDAKIWWVQAEGLNALLLMSGLFPDDPEYADAARRQWAYIDRYLIDHEFGGWYEEGLDRSPEQVRAPKATMWKVNYHNARALMNGIRMLRSECELFR